MLSVLLRADIGTDRRPPDVTFPEVRRRLLAFDARFELMPGGEVLFMHRAASIYPIAETGSNKNQVHDAFAPWTEETWEKS